VEAPEAAAGLTADPAIPTGVADAIANPLP